MSLNKQQFDPPQIYIFAIGEAGTKIIKGRVREQKIYIGKKKEEFSISYDRDAITRAYFGFRKGWKTCIYWKIGTNEAINLRSNSTFIPPLTQTENREFINRTNMELKSKKIQMLSDTQFAILLIMIIASITISMLVLFGVQLNVGSTSTTIQTITNATSTPSPIQVLP